MSGIFNIKPDFITVIDGKKTGVYILENCRGTQVAICNYGARITHFIVKDKDQNPTDIVLGFNSIEDYKHAKERYHGVTIGPFANRISNGSFCLGHYTCKLEINNGRNCLHGGSTGFHDKVWDIIQHHASAISLKVTTKENEGGFPGQLSVTIKYSLNGDDELVMEYCATSSQDTIINLTNHAYFNLNGFGNILSHKIKIEAERFVPVNEDCIPLGILENVADTPFDFRAFKSIGKDIFTDDEQLQKGKGYDHSFEIRKNTEDELSLAATAVGDISGIKLEVLTTEPAVQFYTGNYLAGQDVGKQNVAYEDRTGFCFETQHHPDSPNHPQFPTTVLIKGDQFYSKTIYRISN